ncbi:holin [Listeria monocytogenes]|nr:holin [Listeria monocytogenes]EDN9846492.1 holin [Listeria monocytogenes]
MEFGKEVLLYMTFLTIAATALVQVIKQAGIFPSKYLPLISLVVGVALGGLATYLPEAGPLPVMLWAGGLAGLGGTGLFEQFTNRGKDDK